MVRKVKHMTYYVISAVTFVSGVGIGYVLNSLLNSDDKREELDDSPNSSNSEESLEGQIRKENGTDAEKAVTFENLTFDTSKNKFNILLYFRKQDHDFIRQELENRGIRKKNICPLGDGQLLIFNIMSFDIIKGLPALYQNFPTTLSMRTGI